MEFYDFPFSWEFPSIPTDELTPSFFIGVGGSTTNQMGFPPLGLAEKDIPPIHIRLPMVDDPHQNVGDASCRWLDTSVISIIITYITHTYIYIY